MVYYATNNKNNPIIIPDDMKPIGSGREGAVYNIGGVAVKIVNDLSWMTENKIWFLSRIEHPKLIMMPSQPIYDESDKYSGYSMNLLNCTNAENARLNLMHCRDLIKSIEFINADADLLARQKVALKDTKLRNAVISNSDNLVNVLDPDRFLTPEDPRCYFTEIEEFKKENNYWVNELWYTLFYRMIDQSTDFKGADFKKFRFYMRELLSGAMDRLDVPDFIKDEIKGFDTVEDYMIQKRKKM